MSISFTIADLDQALKDRQPSWADSATFAARRTSAAKLAMSQYFSNLKGSNDIWARGSTLSGSAVSTGTATVQTTIGDCFRIVWPTGTLGVADDTIFLQQSTGVFKLVNRITIGAVVLSGTPTTEGFWENKGEIFFYCKDGEFTAPGNLHFNYWRDPAIDCTTSTNTIDIRPEDFNSFVDSVLSYMATS